MFYVEIIAVIFSLACVILTIRRNVWCWPVGIVGTIAYLYLFLMHQLNADCFLQIVFVMQGIIGWVNWTDGKKNNNLPVTRVNPHAGVRLLSTCLVAYVVLVILLQRYTNSSAIFVDSFVSIASVAANWLLVRKKLESWLLWIVVDIVYIGLFAYKGLYMSSGLYLIFLLLAIQGFYTWNRNLVHYNHGNR